MLNQILSILNLILTFMICCFNSFIDITYSFKEIDFLNRQPSIFTIFETFKLILFSLLYYLDEHIIGSIVHSSLSFLIFFEIKNDIPFYCYTVRRIFIYLGLMHFFLSLSIFFYLFFGSENDLLYIFFLLFGLSFKIQEILFSLYQN